MHQLMGFNQLIKTHFMLLAYIIYESVLQVVFKQVFLLYYFLLIVCKVIFTRF